MMLSILTFVFSLLFSSRAAATHYLQRDDDGTGTHNELGHCGTRLLHLVNGGDSGFIFGCNLDGDLDAQMVYTKLAARDLNCR